MLSAEEFLYHPMILLCDRAQEMWYCMTQLPISNKYEYYMEFGVYKGAGINTMSGYKQDTTFHGFDSFEGLPELWDRGPGMEVEKGHFALSKLPSVRNNVVLYPGWFDATIPKWKKDHKGDIAFLNMDCDLYSSTKTVLTSLNEQIKPGCFIRFDDLLSSIMHPYPNWQEGEWKALIEWCHEYDRKVTPLARSWKNSCLVEVIQ